MYTTTTAEAAQQLLVWLRASSRVLKAGEGAGDAVEQAFVEQMWLGCNIE